MLEFVAGASDARALFESVGGEFTALHGLDGGARLEKACLSGGFIMCLVIKALMPSKQARFTKFEECCLPSKKARGQKTACPKGRGGMQCGASNPTVSMIVRC